MSPSKKSNNDADVVGHPGNSPLPQAVFSVSLSADSPPASSVSYLSSQEMELVHLSERQRMLRLLYPRPGCMEELVEDIIAAFPDRYLCNLASVQKTQSRILRDIFEHHIDDHETIDHLMSHIVMEMKS